MTNLDIKLPCFARKLSYQLICDCGREYIPNKKYKDTKVRCKICIDALKPSDIKKKAIAYLGGKCVDCGFCGHYSAFDFDHKNPLDKSFKISGKFHYRWKELLIELSKCELRCSNCHRIKHSILEEYDRHI